MQLKTIQNISLGILLVYSGLSTMNLHAGNPVKPVSPFNISVWYHHGYLLPHHKSMSFYTIDNINGIEISATRYFPEINDRRPPEIGFGYFHSNLGNLEVYGRSHGLFTSFGSNFFRNFSKIYIQQTTSFGISYNTERFDIVENPFNRVIGSHLNAFIIISLNVRADLGDLTLSAGPSIVHMSNGNIRNPNFGMNLLNTRVGATWKFNNSSVNVNDKSDFLVFEKNNLLLIASGGIRQLSRKIPEEYLVGSVLAEYSRRINRYHAFGAGIDWFYDPTEGMATYVTEKHIENIVPWHIGVHLSWERFWNRFSMVLQPGYKVLTLSEHRFYQFNRAAIRYRIDNGLILNCAIKAHQFRADFIEFGLGYEFHR